MGLFDRVERGLEKAVNGAFARAFKAEVQPVEIAAAMRRAMDDRAAIIGKGRTIVPNLFTVELAPSDYERLTSYADVLSDELIASAQEHAEHQHYQPGGQIQVHFTAEQTLETGVFRVRPSTAKGTSASSPTGRGHDPRGGQAPAPPAPPPVAAPVHHPVATPAPAPPVPPTPSPIIERPSHADTTARHAPPAHPRRPYVNPAERPWLDIDGEHYPLLSAITVLGRDDTSDVILDDPGISRRHTEIRVTSDGPHTVVSIRDLGSTNGTFVNGDRITSLRLEDGDRVTVGRTSMTLRLGRG